MKSSVFISEKFVRDMKNSPLPLTCLSRWLGYDKEWLSKVLVKRRMAEKPMRKLCLNILEQPPEKYIRPYPYDCCGDCDKRCEELSSGDMICCDRRALDFGCEVDYGQKACGFYKRSKI